MKLCRKCSTELTENSMTPARWKNQDWICRPCFRIQSNTRSRRQRKERNDESIAGVYGIYYKDELLYVGESQYCQARFHSHLNFTHKNSKSYIGLNTKKYRHDYRQEIFLEEEDLRLRHLAEIELIVKHKPILNYPYRTEGYVHFVDGEEVLEKKEVVL